MEQVFAGYVSPVPAKGIGRVNVGMEEGALKLSDEEKIAVPYVMECIELLCAAYFERVHDIACAEDAFRVYKLIKGREKRIWRMLL